MTNICSRASCLLCVLLLGACVDTGGGQVQFPLFAEGAAAESVEAGSWSVTLMQADLVFGPLWLCAADGAQASCETARAEYLGAAVVDLLRPEPQELGLIEGTEGFVGTYWFDYGAVSLLTQEKPLFLPKTDELGGSVRIVGRARREGARIDFTATVTLSQSATGVERGVAVVRRATDDVAHVIGPETSRLELQFDPKSLVRSIDFDAFMGLTEVSIDEPATAQTAQAVAAIRTALQGESIPTFRWRENL